jgi:predicted ATP-dependent endonuclease of OLD family
LNLFYNTNIKVDERDYYDENTSEDISITIHYSDLTDSEKKLFTPYLEGQELSIEKVISFSESKITQKYYGSRFMNPDFEAFRKASGTKLRVEYEKLAETGYKEFLPYQNRETTDKILEEWELSHKDKCQKHRDDGQFFGFQNVGMHRLEKYTKFIWIPAVQEASEEGKEERGSVFEEIMEIVVKSTLATNEEIIKLEAEAEERYKNLIDPSKNKDLQGLQKSLTDNLRFFVPDSEVNIQWVEETGVQINPPTAYVTLKEGGYANTVDRCGHGLQRAYILSLFQQLALIQASTSLESEESAGSPQLNLPSLIIGIEEPELYQHPDRQRHFAQTLLQLSSASVKGTFENIQPIYSTHSPLMIDFQRFNQLRIFKKGKAAEEDKPKETYITHTDLAQVSRLVEAAKAQASGSISDESMRQRLIQIMSPWMNEGFFGKIVVLVEGIKDRALILGQALAKNINFESMGICVIPCSGKFSMTEAIAIYKALGIPTYVVWDSDEGDPNGISANQNILRCHGCQTEDYPSMIADDFCCARRSLDHTFRTEIGETDFEKLVFDYCQKNDLGRPSYVTENPYIVSKIIELFKAQGRQSTTLDTIVGQIIKKYNSTERD